MATLTFQRCFNHGVREAAARCPECRQYFCRECITEHDGRVMCAGCFRRVTAPPAARTGRWGRRVAAGVGVVMGLFVAWLTFIALGQLLILLPVKVHDGTIWEDAIGSP